MTSEPSTPDNSSTAPVFVTGAAGHVGANLVRRLLDEGTRVRVLLRHEENNEALEGLEVERVFGDLRDLNSVRHAVEGCQGVYHCAAKVSTIEGNHAHRREIYECNVLGTRNMLQAARETEAGRVVVTGSFSAVGYNLDDPSAPSDETMLFYPMERTMPYERSKTLVEHECWRAASAGQDVLVATCCAVVGAAISSPRDWVEPCAITRTANSMPTSMAASSLSRHGTSLKDTGCAWTEDARARNTSSVPSTKPSPTSSTCTRKSPASRARTGGFQSARCSLSRKLPVLSEPVSSKFPSAFHPGCHPPAAKVPPCQQQQGERGARLPTDQHPRRGPRSLRLSLPPAQGDHEPGCETPVHGRRGTSRRTHAGSRHTHHFDGG